MIGFRKSVKKTNLFIISISFLLVACPQAQKSNSTIKSIAESFSCPPEALFRNNPKSNFDIPRFSQSYFFSPKREWMISRSRSGEPDRIENGYCISTSVASNEFKTVLTSVRYDGGTPTACTATIIGPRTILTAAHCVIDPVPVYNFEIPVRNLKNLREEDQTFKGVCQVHPSYNVALRREFIHDMALCKLDRQIEGFAFGNFESVSLDPLPEEFLIPGSAKPLGFAGYGCSVTGGEVSNSLAVGTALIFNDESCYSYPNKAKRDEERICVQAQSVNKIVVDCGQTNHAAKLCKGDSGGPLFKIDNVDFINRRVVGVATQVNNKTSVSYFASSSGTKIKPYIDFWSKNCGEICGVNSNHSSCL